MKTTYFLLKILFISRKKIERGMYIIRRLCELVTVVVLQLQLLLLHSGDKAQLRTRSRPTGPCNKPRVYCCEDYLKRNPLIPVLWSVKTEFGFETCLDLKWLQLQQTSQAYSALASSYPNQHSPALGGSRKNRWLQHLYLAWELGKLSQRSHIFPQNQQQEWR